jgi:hypothetical protein
MATCALNLPVNIPWKLIAVSADMMDTHFCNKLFPFAWRSSLALSVYEPALEDLPEGLCGQRLTYLKLTSSITGYQPTREETGQIVDYFGDEPTEDQRAVLDQILAEYFACYGVQVNVAVFPGPRKIWKEVLIDFGDLPDVRPDTDRPSPWTIRDVMFEAPGQAAHHLVDRVPPGGDGHAELDLQKELVVTLPPGQSVGRVEARVAHASTSGIRMEVFAAGASAGVKNTGPAQDTIHTLAIEADGIERVVFTAPGNRAVLLSFKYGLPEGVTNEPGGIALDDFPHIIDFEPKLRDLYQAATETGEVLSDSKSGIKTDKSFTHSESTQGSLSLGAKFPLPSGAVGEASGTLAHTDTDQTQWAVAAEASRERRETQATSTQISQMYNLLTGYHVGTNRALFLMLARPHVLQPTDFRTFVQGLRAIEGVQEFFVIVSRPQEMEGLCVEASLETGHFPEDTAITEPEPEYDESSEDFPVTKSAPGGLFSGGCADFEVPYTVAGGWVVDRRPERGPDPGHSGLKMIEDRSNSQAKDSLSNYNYLPTGDGTVSVSGRICGSRFPFGDDAKFDRTYRVFTRSEQPKPSHAEPSADVGQLVITWRELCVCFRSKNACPEVMPQPGRHDVSDGRSIVAEPVIRINRTLLDSRTRGGARGPAMKAFLRQVEHLMANSWRLPDRYPPGTVGFLDTDFFKDQVAKVTPPDVLRTPLNRAPDVPARLQQAFGGRGTIGDVLALDLATLARRAGISIAQARDLRARLLRVR